LLARTRRASNNFALLEGLIPSATVLANPLVRAQRRGQ
jgi:hypothetical protein